MKTCSRCKEEHQEDHFYIKSGSTRRTECRKCWNNIVLRNQHRIKKLCVDYKGGSCQLCGYNKCVGALEFHHIDPTIKDFQISSSNVSSFNDTVKLELDKCLLLCANCHREQHY